MAKSVENSRKRRHSGANLNSNRVKNNVENNETVKKAKKTEIENPNVDGKDTYVRKVIVILEEARIEPVKTSKGNFELLNCDDHLYLHKKLNKDPVNSRPDVLHQCLLTLFDSPLNKAGHLQVYIRTFKNILIEISPSTRIPRTYKRFSGLIVQLLHKMKIRAANGNMSLLKVIKNPITKYIPPDALVFGTSVTGELVDIHTFTETLKDDRVYVFVFGAFAKGNLKLDYTQKMLSFSEYPVSILPLSFISLFT